MLNTGIVSEAGERLGQSWQRLGHQWASSQDLWLDVVQDRFEREIWEEFEREVPATIKSIEELASIILQARRHVRCSTR